MAKSVYDIIKKQNGEKFAQKLRDENLLDIPDIVDIVKYAGRTADDAAKIVPYLWSLKNFTETEITDIRDPFELLHRAGYEYVEYADTLEKQNAIQKHFRPGEELCTFHDEYRYKNYYIVNAVKYNIDSIKPSQNPKRQDEYGTSVISIQMLKTGGFISIKNRYNYTVSNPDNTFDSNPDNIIPGLSVALKQYFNVDWQTSKVSLPDGFALVNNQVIKYNYEVNNTYFGDDFYEVHGKIYQLDTAYQVMLDYFIWDNKQKKLLNPSGDNDAFIDVFNEQILGKQVEVRGRVPNQSIFADDVEIVRTENGKIVSVNFPNVTLIGDGFLSHNKALKEIFLPMVTSIGNYFLRRNEGLERISLPMVTTIGDRFINANEKIKAIELPNVETIGAYFLYCNFWLTEINLPKAKKIGSYFLSQNKYLYTIKLPEADEIGDYFVGYNYKHLQNLYLPQVTKIGDRFLEDNIWLKELDLPNVETIGCDFMLRNTKLQLLNVPRLKNIGDNSLMSHEYIKLNKVDGEIVLHNKVDRFYNGIVTLQNTANLSQVYSHVQSRWDD